MTMTEDQVELGARALFELELREPLGSFALPRSWDRLSPVEMHRFRMRSMAVLAASLGAAPSAPPREERRGSQNLRGPLDGRSS